MSVKTHNGALALSAKVDLRRKVLAAVDGARVFDAYCGPEGEMWRAVWKDAQSYVGCDQAWKQDDPRRRFVGDTTTIMRAIDLSQFNVFDVDAFGSPWAVLRILAARRTWAPGELGAIVTTDGATMMTKFGRMPNDVAAILESKPRTGHRGQDSADRVHDQAMRAWLAQNKLVPAHVWRAQGYSGETGGIKMIYTTPRSSSGEQRQLMLRARARPQRSSVAVAFGHRARHVRWHLVPGASVEHAPA